MRDNLLCATPLRLGGKDGIRQELVELYLSRGASAEEPDAEPWAAPLAWAERYQHDQVARILVESLKHNNEAE